MGTGNNFAKDLGKQALCQPFPVEAYLKDLPTVEVKGKCYRFLNAVGFGIDDETVLDVTCYTAIAKTAAPVL